MPKIKWPESSHSVAMHNGAWYFSYEDEAANKMRTACIEAEEKGRMSVEEILEILRKPLYHHLYKGGFVDPEKMKAEALHTALYGESEEK